MTQTPAATARIRYVYTNQFMAWHRISSLPADNAESDTHAHQYDLEVHFTTDRELMTGAGWVPGELDTDRITQWVDTYLRNQDLTTQMRFPSTPAQLTCYAYDVFSTLTDHPIAKVTLTVDGADRHEFTPEDT